MSIEHRLREFVDWWREHIRGDEKGEAQIFLDHLMRAFGHDGALEAGGRYETRVRRRRNGKATVSFADYLIPKQVLIEMKKRGEDLKKHYTQLEEYWKSLDGQIRPRYALLCNFDEIWIYDFYEQYYDPVDRLRLEELITDRRGALEFLVPKSSRPPVFQENRVQVTKEAAFLLTELYHSLADELGGEIAQRFTLQCMVALFAEDVGLLPDATMQNILHDSKFGSGKSDNAHDLMALLFTMMNYPRHKRRSGRFHNVDYFNGGIFQDIHPLSLSANQMNWLERAAGEDWARIRPSIFGNIFEYSLGKRERHREGAHYTSEHDIKRIVDPVIAEPWRDDIDAVNSLPEATTLYDKLCNYIVLDPACGSGNFLYVAYREMKALESELRDRIAELGGDLSQLNRRVTADQFHGYDINEFAIELAKVSLMIAKKLAVDEFDTDENPLPLDNLDENIRAEDALFNEWVEFDACIGNPPYLGFRDRRREHGVAYTGAVQNAFGEIHGKADFCVYWFRKAHDNMKAGARAGLVGTNSITKSNSRKGSLDYIVNSDGLIYEAIESMPWSGEASVDVSIVNWTKSEPPFSPRRLHVFRGTDEKGEYIFDLVELPKISSSLSNLTDVSGAKLLEANQFPKRVFQGQTTGYNDGFVLSSDEARTLISEDSRNTAVIKPYLRGNDLLSSQKAMPKDFVIDFQSMDILEARSYSKVFQRIEEKVLPFRRQKAVEEQARNEAALAKFPKAHRNHNYQYVLSKWWLHHSRRVGLREVIYENGISRYLITSRTNLFQVFDFICLDIVISDGIQAFPFEDDYSFGILHSHLHLMWWRVHGGSRGTLNPRPTYVPRIFESFPFPQNPSPARVKAVADAGRAIHEYRREYMKKSAELSLREMYRLMERLPGQYELRDLHNALDAAALAAYGFDRERDILEQLLALNFEVAARIDAGEPVTAPGIPPDYPEPADLVSDGCIQPPDLI